MRSLSAKRTRKFRIFCRPEKKALSKLLTVLKIFNTRAKILVLKFFQKNLKKGLIFSLR